MKVFTQIFAVIVVLAITINAQQNKYLVAVELNANTNYDKIEKLNLPIYFMHDDLIISLVGENTLADIEALKIAIKVLDRCNSFDYAVVQASRSGMPLKDFPNTDVVFNGRNFIIVKNLTDFLLTNLKGKFNITRLTETNIVFKNEKVFQNYNLALSDSAVIAEIVSEIKADSVRYFIQSLQNFQTRYYAAVNRDSVANWIKGQFLRMGYTDVKIDSFQYQGAWQKNVVATLHGTINPNHIVIVGGHHDSYSSGNPLVFAPGADDNASGTTAALEIARVLKKKNYQPDNTIRFITFAAEEMGLWGSKDYANKAFNLGMKIKLMINHDMISNSTLPLSQSKVDLNFYAGYLGYRDLAINVTKKFTQINAVVGTQNSSGSDSYSFWQKGFPSIYFEENQFSPYYHSPNDVISNYNMNYCAEVIKGSCATMLTAVFLPSSVENYTISDVGNGSSLLLKWSPVQDGDLSGYKIFIGTTSGAYTQTLTTTDTFKIVPGLTNGVRYYIGIASYDAAGNQSFVVERSGTPYLLPMQPDFIAEAQWHKVKLIWNPNKELDLLGYNIYRSTNQGGGFIKLNSTIYLDSIYQDNMITNGTYYWYQVKAVDSSLNESTSLVLKSRAVSLDQGVLIVDDATEGDGLLFNYTDAQVDNFFNTMLDNIRHQNYDIDNDGSIKLSDLGAFSSILWHGDDLTNLLSPFSSQVEIKKYLDFGGKVFFAGYKPSTAFVNNTNTLTSYSPGNFFYDYLKIIKSESRVMSRFCGAIPKAIGYNILNNDSTKLSSSTGFHLTGIESITAAPQGTEIYSFNTLYDTTSSQGNMKGFPVGVEYIGTNYKTVIVSFPLFFSQYNQSKAFVKYVLENKFGELTSIENNVKLSPKDFKLFQNYPNPFNPLTTIKYAVSKTQLVTITVFDVMGKEIKILVNELKSPGYYSVNFDAAGLSSGVYFYKLATESFHEVRKLVLLK